MRSFPARDSSGLFGLLRPLGSWLQFRSSGISTLPAEAQCMPPGPNALREAAVSVLVVDDNPVNLMVIAAQMEARGLVPLLAADGAEAVALACKLPFDLILMDLQMPVLDGWEATAAIRRFESAQMRVPVPVLAYSTSAPGAGVLAARGLNGSLAKPCSDQELGDCLLRWCPAYRPGPAARA